MVCKLMQAKHNFDSTVNLFLPIIKNNLDLENNSQYFHCSQKFYIVNIFYCHKCTLVDQCKRLYIAQGTISNLSYGPLANQLYEKIYTMDGTLRCKTHSTSYNIHKYRISTSISNIYPLLTSWKIMCRE